MPGVFCSGFLRATQQVNASYPDNTVGIFEYEDGAMAVMDISLRTVGQVRRFEVRDQDIEPRSTASCNVCG